MNDTNRPDDVCTRCGASVPGGTEGCRKLFEEQGCSVLGCKRAKGTETVPLQCGRGGVPPPRSGELNDPAFRTELPCFEEILAREYTDPASGKGSRQSPIKSVPPNVTLPPSIIIRVWKESDFATIQQLSNAEGWPTPQNRPGEALAAWRQSWPVLVATEGEDVIGFLRALTDDAVTTYIAEILVAPRWRRQGIGHALVEACHNLCPPTRLDLLSAGTADEFYQTNGFRRFQGFRKSYQ